MHAVVEERNIVALVVQEFVCACVCVCVMGVSVRVYIYECARELLRACSCKHVRDHVDVCAWLCVGVCWPLLAFVRAIATRLS